MTIFLPDASRFKNYLKTFKYFQRIKRTELGDAREKF
jgi:hypothetical protein